MTRIRFGRLLLALVVGVALAGCAKLAGRNVDPRLGRTRFGDLAERWWAATAGLKPSTRATYRKLLDGHVLPARAGRPRRPPGGGRVARRPARPGR